MSDGNDTRPEQPAFVERRRWPRVAQETLGENDTVNQTLARLYFETASLAPHRQFAAWQEHMAILLETHRADGIGSDDGFAARQTVWDFDGMLFLQQSAPPFSYARSPEMVRYSPIDHWQITFLHAGRTWTSVDGRVAQNEPGKIEIRSFGQPYSGRALAAASVSLIVPADRFADRGNLPAACNNIVLGGHRAGLLIDYMSSLESHLDRLTRDELPAIRDRLCEMVFDTVTPLVDRAGGNDQISQIGLMTRARRFIMGNLASPNLTPDAISRELAISRTRLYEIFETSGGVANYIRRRRLSAAHAMLADTSDTRRVAEVGLAIGFDSAANFSRAFTQQFGYSPSSVRKSRPESEAPDEGEIQHSAQPTLESLLRRLDFS